MASTAGQDSRPLGQQQKQGKQLATPQNGVKAGKQTRMERLCALANKSGPRDTVYMTNGDTYLGEWQGSLRHGKGTHTHLVRKPPPKISQFSLTGSDEDEEDEGQDPMGALMDESQGPDLSHSVDSFGGRGGFGGRMSMKPIAPKPGRVIGVKVYEGEWQFGKRHGYGTLSVHFDADDHTAKESSSAAVVNGADDDDSVPLMMQDKRQPASKKKQPRRLRKVYAGEWSEGNRHGIGTAFYDDGSTYRGQWLAGNRSGWGTHIAADGTRYDGEWQDGKKHGQGILLLPNKDRYEGMWFMDRKEGPGKFVYVARRQCLEGEWVGGQPVFGQIVDLPNPHGVKQHRNQRRIPPLELADPTGVLETERAVVLEQRVKRLVEGSPDDRQLGGELASHE